VTSSTGEQPVLSRRLAGGSPGARGLLLTILGELVLPSGEPAWTAALIEVMRRFDLEEKATRQAVMRTAAAGWLGSERVGRRTRWRLTPAAERLLVEGAQRIYRFEPSNSAWDGRWLVVVARVPETDRRARSILRSRLSWAGLGVLAPGMWISARPDRLDEVRAVLHEAGIDDGHCFTARHDLGDERAMIADAWDLDAIAASYDDFLATFEGDGATDDPLTAQLALVHRWRRFPQIDPGLPRELLPSGWPGDAAAALFARRHEQYSGAARGAWSRLNQD
jgi:phenylacetic acid degradation operon negative regulatory protein